MRFCLIIACSLLPALAAEGPLPAPAPTPASAPRIASVVRVDARSGRLIRTVAIASSAAGPAARSRAWSEVAATIDGYVRQTAEKYEVDPLLVRSVLQVESNYNPGAVSPKGARGLMQLMPATARRFAVRDSFNPWENIDGGVRYLKYLLTMFGDRRAPETLALAAYNAGEGAVLKHGGVPPYQETALYVGKVAKKWQEARAAAAVLSPPQVPAYPPVEQFRDADGVLHIHTRSSP
jgi:soluble lytic murein transglycosylase-like protein